MQMLWRSIETNVMKIIGKEIHTRGWKWIRFNEKKQFKTKREDSKNVLN